MGTIARYNQDKMDAILSDGYRKRYVDIFKGIKKEDFDKQYKERDVETLSSSMMTNIPLLLAALHKAARNEALNSGPQVDVKFKLNIYPYKLDDVTKEELKIVFDVHVSPDSEVDVIDVPLEFLTPAYCKENFAAMVMYDFKEWMTMYSEQFKEFRMTNVVVYAPEILDRPLSDEDRKEIQKAQIDIFDAAVFAAAPAFGLRFLTIDMFSMRDPEKDHQRMILTEALK